MIRHRATVRALCAGLFAVWAGVAHPVRAQNPCEARDRVRGLEFRGRPQFDHETLRAAIVTQAPTFAGRVLRVGALPCSDPATIELDALRLAVLHRQAGWLRAVVRAATPGDAKGVTVRFEVTPGPAFVLDSLNVDGIPATDTAAVRPLAALRGARFDRVRFDTTVTAVVMGLRDQGYARAVRPDIRLRIDSSAARVRATVVFHPGARTTVRRVTVGLQGIGSRAATIDTAAVRRLTGLRPGRRFRAADILEAQRELYRADVFRLALIDTLTPDLPRSAQDTLIDLHITVAEARARTARVGAGWATLDCGRVQGRLVDRRTLGIGQRVELNARASKLGVGAPADIAPQLCSAALRADTQFTVLNHYLGATITSTHLFGTPLSPVTSVYTERRSEPYAYVREIGVGALVELSGQMGAHRQVTAGVQYENGRTQIDPAESCARFGQCRPNEIAQALFGRGVGVVSMAITEDRTNNTIDPGRGVRVRGELRAGQTESRLDPTVRFARMSGDAAAFRRIAGGVLALRVQVAQAVAPGARLVDGSPLIPQQERLFAGGQNTVRGFQQNLLGPLVYVVSRVDTVARNGAPVVQAQEGAPYDRALPRGGTALAVANLEFRRPLRWLADQLQVVGFVDAGNVWESRGGQFRWADIRATPGLGVRVITPLGPFRVDVGYSPYPPRAGRALVVTRGVGGTGGTIRCASPGNAVSIDPTNPGSIFDCPETYAPPAARGVLSRLAFHFGLGQAF